MIPCPVIQDGTACGRPVHCKGMCRTHQARKDRHGDPLTLKGRKPGHSPCLTREELDILPEAPVFAKDRQSQEQYSRALAAWTEAVARWEELCARERADWERERGTADHVAIASQLQMKQESTRPLRPVLRLRALGTPRDLSGQIIGPYKVLRSVEPHPGARIHWACQYRGRGRYLVRGDRLAAIQRQAED